MLLWKSPTLTLIVTLLQYVTSTYADAPTGSDSHTASFNAIWSFRESNLIRQQHRKNALASRQYGATVPTDVNGTQIPPYTALYTFDQLIDHDNPSKGTFKQRFWYTWEFYKPGIPYFPSCWTSISHDGLRIGGPIVLTTPGESNAASKHSHENLTWRNSRLIISISVQYIRTLTSQTPAYQEH